MADAAYVDRSVHAAPKDYTLAASQELLVKAVRASIDGSGAAATFQPALQCVAPDGTVMWTAIPATNTAAGGSVDCSWFHGLNGRGSVPPPPAPSTELDYVERNTNATITAVTPATAQTIITGSVLQFDGLTRVRVELFAMAAQVQKGNEVLLALWDNANDLGNFAAVGNQGAAVTDFGGLYATRLLTPSAGSHQFTVRGFNFAAGSNLVYGASGGAGVTFPMFYRVIVV